MAIVAVGHRGTSIGIPENSLISHETAYGMGARGIEFDIRMSADGAFVVFHDTHVDDKTNGTGKVKNMSLAELKALRLLYDGQSTPHQIPTLEEALKNVRGRFMVDLDFKSGPDASGELLRQTLKRAGFNKEEAPLVTIFCRDNEDYHKVKSLNDLYAVRPLYLGKGQVAGMRENGIRVMGLRNYQFTLKRARRLRKQDMQLFTNAMQYNPLAMLRERLGFKHRRKKPDIKTLERIYKQAIEGGSLFIQTDYLPELVKFLKANNVYQDRVMGRDFQALNSKITRNHIM